MTILTTSELGKHFGGQDIFANLNFSINLNDKIALVGPNGEGKTTLLRILAGLESASEGKVTAAKAVRISYLEQHASLISTEGTLWSLALSAFQHLKEQEAAIQTLAADLADQAEGSAAYHKLLKQYGEVQALFEHAGGYTYEQTIRLVLTGLGFRQGDYETPLNQLSGGQQSRAHLAKLLLDQPDLLLLDEPTNHLDLDSVEWLEYYLQQWPKAFVVVSHDRYFLDKVANRVWEMNFGILETYRGNFSHYVQQRIERFERRLKEYQTQQEFIAKEEEFIQRNLAGQRTKEAQGRRKRLDRLVRLERPRQAKTLNLALRPPLRSGDLVLATHDLVVGYPDNPVLLTCPDLEIQRGQCIALIGPNGAGKTTFIKTILTQLQPPAGNVRFGSGVKVGYFAQTHASLNLENSILDEILSVENLPIGEARNYLGAFLFSGDDVFKPIKALSGGERSRVALAKLTLMGANFLILDEPTNHLDIPSQEILESGLRNFAGTILLTSHDRYFIDAVASHVWALEPQTKSVRVVKGGYSRYLALREVNFLEVPPDRSGNGQAIAVKSESQVSREQSKAKRREAEKKAKQVAEIEGVIEATEARLVELTEKLEAASQAQDIPKLQQLGQDYQDTEAKLEALFNEWAAIETT